MRVVLVMTVAIGACGGAPEVAPQATTRAAASPIATSTGPSDEIVANVNGRPVWASCVAAQGAKIVADHAARVADHARSTALREKLVAEGQAFPPVPPLAALPHDPARAALDACIEFELLAQQADKRDLGADPDVVDATRAAIVNRLVETGFEHKYTKPADLGDRLDKWYRDNEWRLHRPELRSSAYVRAVGDTPEAKAAAQAVYDKLATETGLFTLDLQEASKLPTGAVKIEYLNVSIKPRDQLDKSYAAALFSIPEVGRVSPPTKTPWGWDVILWTGGLAAKETTREELAAEAFPDLRRSMFPIWVAQIARELGVTPVIDQAQLARLDEVGP